MPLFYLKLLLWLTFRFLYPHTCWTFMHLFIPEYLLNVYWVPDAKMTDSPGLCHICEATYLLTLICNSEISTCSTFVVIHRHAQSSEKLELMHTFPAEVEQGNVWPSYFSSHTINKSPFHGLFGATFFACLCFFWSFHCLWPQSVVPECCLVFLSTRSCDVSYRENTC